MQRFVLACAAVALVMIASPLAAVQTLPEQPQQTGPNQPASPTTQSMPDESQPPAAPQAGPLPSPPPFPPMPRTRPSHRWVDAGDHHATKAHHRATQTHHRRTQAHQRAAHPSRQTIRGCHSLSYGQIMRRSQCRALIRQDLDAAERRHHRVTHRHRTVRHATSRRHHHATRQRRT
jgi:hypothetical protein